jgi:hypothetical protein
MIEHCTWVKGDKVQKSREKNEQKKWKKNTPKNWEKKNPQHNQGKTERFKLKGQKDRLSSAKMVDREVRR